MISHFHWCIIKLKIKNCLTERFNKAHCTLNGMILIITYVQTLANNLKQVCVA